MTSLAYSTRRSKLAAPLFLVVVLTICLMCAAGHVPATAGEYDWATPSGPLPNVPDPGDPIPDGDSYNGGGGGSSTPAPRPRPAPEPSQGQATPQPVTQTPVTPAAPVDPQQQFENTKEAVLKEFHMPAALTDDLTASNTASAAVSRVDGFGNGAVPAGLSESEWTEAAECQRGLDELYAKWPLSAEEIAKADKLESQRNTAWAKAISVPGLTAEERERLRLQLHTFNPRQDATIPTVSEETLKKWSKPPPPLPTEGEAKTKPATVNPVASWLVGEFALGQAQSALELGGEVWSDQIVEENSFGDFVGIGKIALAYKEGGVSSALKETGDYLLGKIPIPQASMAVEGGRQYANVVFQVQNKFMTDAMKAAGGEFDKEKFWSDFNEDLTTGQKAVKGWIGYGSE